MVKFSTIVGAALIAAAVLASPIANAGPNGGWATTPPGGSAGSGDVYGGGGIEATVDVGQAIGGGPFSYSSADRGSQCSNWDRYIFGQAPTGQVFACVSFDGLSGTWVPSAPFYGIQPVGLACPPPAAAQSPDGFGLVCTPIGWQPSQF